MQNNTLHGFSVCVNEILAVYFLLTCVQKWRRQRERPKKVTGLLYIDLARAKTVAPVNKLKNLNQTINLESTNL